MSPAAPERPEHRWPALIAIIVAAAAFALHPPAGGIIPPWIVPIGAAILLLPLVILNPHRITRETVWSRWLSIGLAVALTVVNQVQVVTVIARLLDGQSDASTALLTAVQVWVTDVIAFGLIYWELDQSGPFSRRLTTTNEAADFRFPQDDNTSHWQPGFFDYLYFSASNMMAFSPTDVMPLTTRAKALMLVQALTGFALLALVIARAVNIVGA
ncbi:MAG TPA: DUF1345 domain-containing protein [Pseudolysinimonas sp.]|nr:DUF1345 domain-containing protein [Pseudolysinimonas sp.]